MAKIGGFLGEFVKVYEKPPLNFGGFFSNIFLPKYAVSAITKIQIVTSYYSTCQEVGNMKKMKRLLVLCLVATLCMGLAVPAMAANASQAEAYVTQLYRGLLNREPDDAGKLSYVTQIVTNGAKAGTIAESVAGSAEFRARILTNEEYVTALYRGLLDNVNGTKPDR